MNQAINPETKVGFAANVATIGLIFTFAVAVILKRAIPKLPFCNKFPLSSSGTFSVPLQPLKTETHLFFEAFAAKLLTFLKIGRRSEKGFKYEPWFCHPGLGFWGFKYETVIEDAFNFLGLLNLKIQKEERLKEVMLELRMLEGPWAV